MTTNMIDQSKLRIFAVLAALALALSACGDSETDASNTTAVEETTSTTVSSTTSTTVDSTVPETSASTTVAPVDDADLPGDPFDFGPGEGSTVNVVGVAADDVLNIRRLPDASSEAIAELAPTDDTTLTGRKRDLATSIWYEVETNAGVGWANAAFLAPIGGTRDATNEFKDLFGDLPTGASTAEVVSQLQDLLLADAEGDEGPPRVVVVVEGPTDGDLDEVVIDVLGYPDDAVRGDRLRVFIMSEAGTSGIKTIEATSICQRGSDGAFCL